MCLQKFDFMGVTFDEHLNWKLRIERCALTCSMKIGMLNQLKHNNNAYIIPYLGHHPEENNSLVSLELFITIFDAY